MARTAGRISRKTYYAMKMKQAVHLLFYKRHNKPGVRGWELKKSLGSDYPKVVSLLDNYLEKLDLKVNIVFEEETPPEKPSLEQYDRARFFVTLRGSIKQKELKMMGWRIDDLAGLAMAVSYIISKKGKTPRKNVEAFLRTKLPGWRVDINLDRYIKQGYLDEDENNRLYLDWRTRAEVDQKELVDLLLRKEETT